jgi:hypothetical protein
MDTAGTEQVFEGVEMTAHIKDSVGQNMRLIM